MSAGYDGRVIIWDIWEGQPVRVYETGDFQIVDGSFSPDGTSIVVSDEVGQFYLLTTGQGQSQKDAKYDQFFLGDFRPLVRDLQGNVLDQETQLPPHQRNIRDLLCDANMIPYPEPYQSMYQQRRLGALGIEWQPLDVNLAVGMDDMSYFALRDHHPPVFRPNFPGSPIGTADDGARRWVEQPVDVDEEMDWEQDVAARPSDDSGSEYSVSEESLSLLDDEEEDERSASSTEHLGHSDEDEDYGEESLQETHLRRSNRNKRKLAEVGRAEERKLKKLSSALQQTERGNDETEEDTQKQGQVDLVVPSVRLASHRQITRPKRAAATNALQMFSHICMNDDGEEEEASSSQQETSSYNGEEECESEGLPTNDQMEDENGCAIEKKDKEVEPERTELSQTSEREVLQDLGRSVFKPEQREGGESQVNSEEIIVAERASDESLSVYRREEAFFIHKNHENSGGLKNSVPQKDIAPARLDSIEHGYQSNRPRSQRRLVLKLRKSDNDGMGSVRKADLEDPICGDTPSQKTADTERPQDSSKRKIRRLILRGPSSAAQAGHTGLSDADDDDDDGHCSASQKNGLQISDFGKAAVQIQFTTLKNHEKGKKSHEAVSSVPLRASPLSSGHGYDRPTSICGADLDSLREAPVGVHPDETADVSNFESDAGSRGANWADDVETRQTHYNFNKFEGEVEPAPMVQRISSPESVVRLPPSGQSCSSNEILSEEDGSGLDKAVATYRTCSDVNRVSGEGEASDDNDPLGLEREQHKVVSGSKGVLVVCPRKSRKNSAHKHDNPEFDQMSHECYLRSQVSESPNSVGHSSSAGGRCEFERIESEERDAIRDGSNGAVEVTLEDMDELDQQLAVGHIDTDSDDEDLSWTESENVLGQSEGQNLRQKRRTLGDLGSKKKTTQRAEEDSISRRKVRQMQSVMLEGVTGSRVKGSRGRRVFKKEKEGLDTEINHRKQGAWTYKGAEFRRYGSENTAANTPTMDDNSLGSSVLHRSRSRRGLGRGERVGASNSKEKRELRASSRTKREATRTSNRHQGTQSETGTSMRDKGVRTRKSLAWLLQSDVEETRYIPQFGDEVVYLRQGHEEYLDTYKLNEPGPWTIYGDALSHSEVCQVVGLEFTIVPDSGETCCRFTLEFVGCSSQLLGKTFWLTLPELTNFPDFIVEKGRYDASIERKWTYRDRCKVWWRSQSGQGGEWWGGRVVKMKAKSTDFPDSPWERIIVQYKYDLSKEYAHSPWELFDLGDTRWERPHIDAQTRERLLLVLESAANEPEDVYGLLRLKQASCRADFLNRLPLPLTLDVLMQRLEKDYYHSTQAFFFDSQLLAANAESYCGPQHSMAQGLQAFVRELEAELFSDPSL